MAARRNKSQARRHGGGGGGLPGWAWLVIGVLLTLLLLAALVLTGVVSTPKTLGGDGFFRPQPNPDAQPAPVDEDAEAVVPEDLAREGDARRPARAADAGEAPADDADYDFYTLLPGRETPMTEAEVAATAQAEARRAEAQARAGQARDAAAGGAATATTAPSTGTTLPTPVDDTPARDAAAARGDAGTAPATTAGETPAPSRVATASTAPPAPIGDGSRYVLQAGAFQASGQAEELKAKIAMLGLGARVESAQIGGKTVYRVRMGPYGTASDLAEAKRKLAGGGLQGMAVKVD